jgi:hypothetical protein
MHERGDVAIGPIVLLLFRSERDEDLWDCGQRRR